MRKVDYSGKKFGRLLAVEMVREGGKDARVRCLCDCGNLITVLAYNFKNGNTKSCGCYSHESRVAKGKALGAAFGKASLRHGHTAGGRDSKTYVSWSDAKKRCYNPANKRYAEYGGRGIGMCEEWRGSFDAFLRDMGEVPQGFTLERIDVNRSYEPGNCAWVPKEEQPRNTRANVATWESVREIRFKHAAGHDKKALASAYGMSVSNVKMIVSGATWKES
ncbi:MAG: hypothetical protein KGH96_23200 [Sphingomonadales bacterium]|nr:hypothetical protein [Sphingomonadales bacterium]